jgi:hypothetical protein
MRKNKEIFSKPKAKIYTRVTTVPPLALPPSQVRRPGATSPLGLGAYCGLHSYALGRNISLRSIKELKEVMDLDWIN